MSYGVGKTGDNNKRSVSQNWERETMNIEVRTIGDVKVLDGSGKITLGEGTMALRNRVRDIVQGGNKKIILNLADVTYIDSSGVGELVTAYTTVTNLGGKLKLLNLTKRSRELLSITKLLTVFDVYDNEQAAVASFK
jgi:anti-sigma B factor antagonist